MKVKLKPLPKGTFTAHPMTRYEFGEWIKKNRLKTNIIGINHEDNDKENKGFFVVKALAGRNPHFAKDRYRWYTNEKFLSLFEEE